MVWTTFQTVLMLHIFLAIIWVGGILFVGWGIYPTVHVIPFKIRRIFLQELMEWAHPLLTGAGLGVIITGIFLGTVLGPIKKIADIWQTTYGSIWFIALIVAIFTLLWGTFVGFKTSIKVFTNKEIWEKAESGDKLPLNKALRKTMLFESVEIFGFIILIMCMVVI